LPTDITHPGDFEAVYHLSEKSLAMTIHVCDTSASALSVK